MSRLGAGEATSLRSALLVVLAGVVAALTPWLIATAVDAPSSVVLAAVFVTVVAMMASSCRLVTLTIPVEVQRPRDGAHLIPVLGGSAIDPVHHPRRPRAPGLA